MDLAEAWNLWELKPPPICTVKTNLNSKEISGLNEVTFDALKTVRNLDYFDKEAAILSRFLYKNRRIFRHDKGTQNLVNVNRCLKRYLKLDMSGMLLSFKESLPFKYKPGTTHAYLPTKQMLKWILLRLQAFSQLFVRVIELTKETGSYIYQKLCLGWSLNLSLLAFAITARILATSKYLVAKSIEWYSAFYKYLPFLEQTADFLPNYKFPKDLKLWLGEVDLKPLKRNTFIDKIFECIDLAKEDEEGEDKDNEVKIVNEKLIKDLFKSKVAKFDSDVEEITVEDTEEKKKGMKRPFQTPFSPEDLGVLVSEEVEVLERQTKKRKNKKGKNPKQLNDVKKTLKTYKRDGMPVSSGPNNSSGLDSDDSCVKID